MSEEGFRDLPPLPPVEAPEMPPQTGSARDPAPAEAPTILEDGKVRYRLLFGAINVPGKGGMQEKSEIVCRRPTGADMLAVGNPVRFNPATGSIDHDVERMPVMVFRLSGITPGSLAKMDTRDLAGLFWSITHFFLPTPGAI